MTHVERIRVRYGETDRMGHAYYGSYALFFEQARSGFCRAVGMPYPEVEARGYLLPVVEATFRYKGEILYEDEMEISIWVAEMRRSSLRFEYEIRVAGDERIRTTGHTVHVLVDANKRPVSIPDDIRERFAPDANRSANPVQ